MPYVGRVPPPLEAPPPPPKLVHSLKRVNTYMLYVISRMHIRLTHARASYKMSDEKDWKVTKNFQERMLAHLLRPFKKRVNTYMLYVISKMRIRLTKAKASYKKNVLLESNLKKFRASHQNRTLHQNRESLSGFFFKWKTIIAKFSELRALRDKMYAKRRFNNKTDKRHQLTVSEIIRLETYKQQSLDSAAEVKDRKNQFETERLERIRLINLRIQTKRIETRRSTHAVMRDLPDSDMDSDEEVKDEKYDNAGNIILDV